VVASWNLKSVPQQFASNKTLSGVLAWKKNLDKRPFDIGEIPPVFEIGR
jgi:hypothetical protein